MVISLLDIATLRKNKLGLVLYLLVIVYIGFLTSEENVRRYVVVLNYFIIIFIILKDFIVAFVNDKKINLFLLMLIFYLFTSLLKMFNLIIGFTDAIAFFYITTFFQILFGFFFSIFREDNPKVVIQF
ncbi:hypothetical protein ABRY23_04360 [Melioribacteraceae bacterium 4301-Me]|uniref:hypothetical protein n=1 Tax=Pyranulibacter aquaticus TaxID=3163344 RepID=UPI0035979F38